MNWQIACKNRTEFVLKVCVGVNRPYKQLRSDRNPHVKPLSDNRLKSVSKTVFTSRWCFTKLLSEKKKKTGISCIHNVNITNRMWFLFVHYGLIGHLCESVQTLLQKTKHIQPNWQHKHKYLFSSYRYNASPYPFKQLKAITKTYRTPSVLHRKKEIQR